jgi:hypothetical protein
MAARAKLPTYAASFIGACMLLAMSVVRPSVAAVAQPTYASPDAAVAALVQAVQSHDPASIGTVLGPGSEPLVRSGDPVKDRQEADRFLGSYNAHHTLAPEGADRVALHVGDDDWALPIPIVRSAGAWHFDARAGAQEIVDRRIGKNELEAIRFCLAYVDAQKAYFEMFKQATGTGVYAQRLVSTPGNYDGLYWPSAPNTPDSPLTALVASAVEEGYPSDIQAGKRVPYQGYYFRVLKAQGPEASGGRTNYVQAGKMTGGFGLVAWPVTYGVSGIMTLVVNQDGIVFQKDLGPRTETQVARIDAFNPGFDWTRVDVTPQ